ncbi:hypothetical protein D3C75_902020 [compost metagenome]
MTVAHQLARQKHQDSQFAGALTVLGVPHQQRPAIRSLLKSRWGRVTFASDSAGLMQSVAGETGKLLVWRATEPGNLQPRAKAHGVPLWRISPSVLQSPGGDEQPLAQIRGMPCSPQQAHNTYPKPGLLESCARYRQIRRYLRRLF